MIHLGILKGTKFTQGINKLKEIFLKAKVKPSSFAIAAILALVAALCEGVSVLFLVPTIKGILLMNFSFVKDLPVIKIIIPYLSKYFPFGNTAIFILLISIIFCTAILKNILQYISSLMVSRQIRKISTNLRKAIFNNYLNAGKSFFDKHNIGYLQSVLLHYINIIMAQLVGIGQALMHIFILLIYLIIMFLISAPLTLIIIVIFPPLYFILRGLINKIKIHSRTHISSYNELSRRVSNILTCIPLVKLYTSEEQENKRFAFVSDQIQCIELSIDKKYNLINPLQEMFLLVVVLILVSAMSFLVVKEKTGQLASYLVFFYIFRMSFRSIGIFTNLRSGLAIAKGPIVEVSNMLKPKETFNIYFGALEFKGLKAEIEFRNVNFSYLQNTPVINNLSFFMEKGKLTAIVGPSGSGKTTIINLLLRFYDCPPASIFIDGTDIREFSRESLMKHMALVSQESLLFHDSLRNNIIYGLDNTIAEQDLINVVKKARLYDFIISLPQGLDTYIGDRGIRLSGGEKQRIAIARALLKEVEILFLDEATSSLDTTTEKLIRESIEQVMKNRTSIVIAHRLSTIKNADKIIVIEKGRVVEEGNLNELLIKEGIFFRYWQEQRFL